MAKPPLPPTPARPQQEPPARKKANKRARDGAASAGKDYAPLPGQSVALLQALHILTREGKLNQDARRKLKQVQHLTQFITPLLEETLAARNACTLVDHGAGKSYLGFILYDLFFKPRLAAGSLTPAQVRIIGIEQRAELVAKSRQLAQDFGFSSAAGGMEFVAAQIASAPTQAAGGSIPAQVDVVTALHACDTATDDAIAFALAHRARHIVLVPCCQAEVAAALRTHKRQLQGDSLSAFWQHPIHTREFGSHLTNVLRTLQLAAHGYQLTVTELVGWEHSMKNELLIASKTQALPRAQRDKARTQLAELLARFDLPQLHARFALAVQE